MSAFQRRTWIIAASLENIDPVCSAISGWLVAQNLSEQLFSMELLAREAINNAMIHGSNLDPVKMVQVELQCDQNALRLMVIDEGPGFNWRAALEKDMVDGQLESGRGIRLYQLYADRVEFNDKGNQVVLIRSVERNTTNIIESQGERR